MMEKLDKAMTFAEIQTEQIKQNSIRKIIENQRPHILPEGAKRAYHITTRDWIAGEIFRRIDPEKAELSESTLRQFSDQS